MSASEIKIKNRDHSIYKSILGALLLVLFIVVIIWQLNKDSQLRLTSNLIVEFETILFGDVIVLVIYLALYALQMRKNRITRWLTIALVTITICGIFITFSSNFRLNNTKHYDSLNHNNHRYHLDERTDEKSFESVLIVWECGQFGVICRQIKTMETPSLWFMFPPTFIQLDIDPETGMFRVISDDESFIIERAR